MAIFLFMLYHCLTAWQTPTHESQSTSLLPGSLCLRLVLLLRGLLPCHTGRILLKGDNITLMQTVGRQAAA